MPEEAGQETAAPDKPKVDYGSPEQLAIYDAETQERVNAQADEVEEAEHRYEGLKSAASEAKKDLEALEKRLRTLIRERHDRRGKPPAAVQQALFPDAGGDGAQTEQVWPPESLWEKFPIERLMEYGLHQSDVDKFKAGECKKGIEGIGPIDTMGAMSRFTAPADSGWCRKLTDIKGIGQATLDRYSEAETKFWDAWKNAGLAERFAEECGIKKPEVKEDGEDPEAGGETAVEVAAGEPAPDQPEEAE